MSLLYIGCDISQASFTSSGWVGQAAQELGQYTNEPDGFAACIAAVNAMQQEGGYDIVHVVLEATGGYELPLLVACQRQGWQFSLPNPKQVRDWAKGRGYRVKHDRIDGRILAHYGSACQPKAQEPVSAVIEELDSLLQRQADIEKSLRQEKNRAHALTYRPQAAAAVVSDVAATIVYLEAALQRLGSAIAALLAANPELQAQKARLLTVAGVGAKTVLPLLVYCHRYHARTAGQGTAKGFTAFAGLDSQEFSSGHSVRKRPTISKMGSKTMRAKLYLAALGGTRSKNSPLRHFYLRLLGRNKSRKLALVAASRKILVWSWAVFQQGVDFDPSRFPIPAN
ncbi:MAG: transposase [Anaerolineales bacterium]|nr:transposase [Anaerolineales bacterium]